MDRNCVQCRHFVAAERTLKALARTLGSSTDEGSPRYLDTKGTFETRVRDLERSKTDHEADAHYLDLLVMCSDTLALMSIP